MMPIMTRSLSNLAPIFVTNAVILKARSEVEEKIHDAMEAAMAAGERREECVILHSDI